MLKATEKQKSFKGTCSRGRKNEFGFQCLQVLRCAREVLQQFIQEIMQKLLDYSLC